MPTKTVRPSDAARPKGGRPARRLEDTTFMQSVGAKIRAARGDRTLEDIARGTGGLVTIGMISQYESGRMEPRLKKWIALTYSLGVGLVDLLPDDVGTGRCPLGRVLKVLSDTVPVKSR